MCHFSHFFSEFYRAESPLFIYIFGRDESHYLRVYVPTFTATDAVLHRKMPSLRGTQIISLVGILCGKYILRGIFFYLVNYILNYVLCLGTAKRAVNKVILHIDYEQYLSHKTSLVQKTVVTQSVAKFIVVRLDCEECFDCGTDKSQRLYHDNNHLFKIEVSKGENV